MKILLILISTVSFVACLGNPAGYQRETIETGRNSNIQIQNSAPEEVKVSREHYQASRENNQPIRQEYRRFGKDALPMSSQADNIAVGYNANERKPTQNQNSEILTTFSNKNQINKFPPASANEGTQVQKSSFQDLRSDSHFPYTPVSQIQTTFSTQETRRPGNENIEDQASITSVHSQEIFQKGTPFAMERRSEIQSGMYQNNFGASFPRAQDQISPAEEAAFQNQNNFRSQGEDQRFETQQTFYQNEARRDQEQQSFPQQDSFAKQDQITSTHRSQEQANQYQKSSQQNQRASVPAPSYENDSFYNQGRIAFDSRRISPATPVSQPLEHASGDENKYISTPAQFPRSQENENPQSRQISEINTNVHFKDNKRGQTENHKQNLGNIQGDRQGLFHGIEQNQPTLTMSKFPQSNAPVLVSAAKGVPSVPVMVYKTGSVASPHAVVLGRDLNVLNKASVSQHVQTPYTQYTYAHPL